jgi:chemotaxis protein methyltransferase CheR
VTRAAEQISELVRRESGIVLPDDYQVALRTALGRSLPGMDADSFLRLSADLAAGPEAVARLLDEVTVKETFFFRDPDQLAAIDWNDLLAGARARGSETIDIWSAGCASGEEAYTLALLALDAFGPRDTPVRILATDISRTTLVDAAAGLYRERALRLVDPALRERYFEPAEGQTTAIGPAPRSLVRFGRHNLVRDPVPPLGYAPFDLVLCRNVLIYFDGPTVELVIDALEGALRPDGMLILGAADALCGTVRGLARTPRRETPQGRRARDAAPLRRPLGRAKAFSRDERLAAALLAAGAGRPDDAVAGASAILAENPLDAEAHFVRGLVELEQGRGESAIEALRRALYVDPGFGLAAFQLGRAYDATNDSHGARRAYEQALRTLADDGRHDTLLEQVDLGDVASACRARLLVLA